MLRRKRGLSFEVCNTLLVNDCSYYGFDVTNVFHRHFCQYSGYSPLTVKWRRNTKINLPGICACLHGFTINPLQHPLIGTN